ISMAILTADHLIGEPDQFRNTVDHALNAAEREGALVTIGITPDRPETGYGYIEADDSVKTFGAIAHVKSFREKPDEATARKFVESGHFFWNSGMFFWTLPAFLSEITHASPGHAAAAHAMSKALQQHDAEAVARSFESLPDISIDYALMEKAGKV